MPRIARQLILRRLDITEDLDIKFLFSLMVKISHRDTHPMGELPTQFLRTPSAIKISNVQTRSVERIALNLVVRGASTQEKEVGEYMKIKVNFPIPKQ